MSSMLAIASVTALLKNLLDNELIQQSALMGIGDVVVTALPPDRIATGTDERPQLNLYLYRLTPNTRWRRMDTAQSGLQDTVPLALDLHYLVTAYGESHFQAEILLGQAMQVFHETASLTPEFIRLSLRSLSSKTVGSAPNALQAAFSASPLLDQQEPLKLSLEFLSMDEMSKLWSGLQTRSRLSVTYKVSTLDLESGRTITMQIDDQAKGKNS